MVSDETNCRLPFRTILCEVLFFSLSSKTKRAVKFFYFHCNSTKTDQIDVSKLCLGLIWKCLPHDFAAFLCVSSGVLFHFFHFLFLLRRAKVLIWWRSNSVYALCYSIWLCAVRLGYIFFLVRMEDVVYSRLVSLIFCLFPFVSSRINASKHSSIGFPANQSELATGSFFFGNFQCVCECVRVETYRPAVYAFIFYYCKHDEKC